MDFVTGFFHLSSSFQMFIQVTACMLTSFYFIAKCSIIAYHRIWTYHILSFHPLINIWDFSPFDYFNKCLINICIYLYHLLGLSRKGIDTEYTYTNLVDKVYNTSKVLQFVYAILYMKSIIGQNIFQHVTIYAFVWTASFF